MESKRRFMTTLMSSIFLPTFMRMESSTLVAKRETGTMLARALDWESKLIQSFVYISLTTYVDLKSRNINIPWPSQGMGDGDYMFAFQQLIMPIATEFDPDLVIGKSWAAFAFLCLLACQRPWNHANEGKGPI